MHHHHHHGYNNNGASTALALISMALGASYRGGFGGLGGFGGYNNVFSPRAYGGYQSPFMFGGIRPQPYYRSPKQLMPGLNTPGASSMLSGVLQRNSILDPSGLSNIPYSTGLDLFPSPYGFYL